MGINTGAGAHGPGRVRIGYEVGRRDVARMKQLSPVRVDCRVTPDGGVHAVLRGPGAASREHVAVALDGVVCAVVKLTAAGRAARHLNWELPRQTIAAELDLLGVEDGETLLGAAIALQTVHALRAAPPKLQGLVLQGSFSGAAFLADRLGVELVDEAGPVGQTIVGQTLAHRVPGSDTWQYSLPAGVLLVPGRSVKHKLRIGGLVLRSPVVALSAADLGYVGCMDVATPRRVEGWAINLRAPDRPVMLEVVVDTAVVVTVAADKPRHDLRGAARPDGRCGFAVDLPEAEDPHHSGADARSAGAVRYAARHVGAWLGDGPGATRAQADGGGDRARRRSSG